MHSDFPQARRDGFVIQPLDGELLLYDGEVTHLLNPTAAAVWQLCDGHHSVADLSRELVLAEPTVRYALQQLEQQQLLENYTPLATQPITRREFLKRTAIAAAAVPVVQTLRLPSPSAAVSGCLPFGVPCELTNPGVCCSGTCAICGDNCYICS